MRTEEKNGITHYYFYREDLEKKTTLELISILRSLRRTIWNTEWDDIEEDSLKNMEGTMVEFKRGDNFRNYAVLWIVKDILANRPHVNKSKQERKVIRQQSAKLHKRI